MVLFLAMKASKTYRYIFIVIISLGIVFAFAKYHKSEKAGPVNPEKKTFSANVAAADPKDFPGLGLNFDQLKQYFQDLAKNKGARYAYGILKAAPLGPNIDLHLLGHVVGDELYKQEGLDGITSCNNDFRNACSHSIVVGLFYDKGDGALPEIAQACRKAPGGSGAYTMCFHGLGHGILAYEGYDMEKAAVMCQKTGTKEYAYQEPAQCQSGTVMEIVGGGGHDHEIWASQRPKYLDPKHPTSLCEQAYFPDNAKFFCYEYITPYLFEAAGANLGNPTPADFKIAFTFCASVPTENKNNCYSGFGKEFVGIVQSRDIRQDALVKISDVSLSQVYKWCMLAGDTTGQAACVIDAMNNLYWGGENDPSIALRFCAQVADGYNQKSCYLNLVGSVSYYIKEKSYKEKFCSQVPDAYQVECKTRLGL